MSARQIVRELVELIGRDAASPIIRDALRSDSPMRAAREALDDAWSALVESESQPRDPMRRCATKS